MINEDDAGMWDKIRAEAREPYTISGSFSAGYSDHDPGPTSDDLRVWDGASLNQVQRTARDQLAAEAHRLARIKEAQDQMNPVDMGRFQYPTKHGADRPALTVDQYQKARAILDMLPPGIYVKCANCKKWKTGGTLTITGDGTAYCEDCG